MTAPATTAAQHHLHTVINSWGHLDDMLDTHVAAPWPPAGRITDYLAQLDLADARHVHRQRTGQELEVPAGQPPLNLDVLDTKRAVEAALLATADHIARQVQRAPLHVDTGRGWTDPTHRQAALLAAKDQADPTRWSYTNPATRDAPRAAAWLLHRLQDAPGPFRPLHIQQHDRITAVAAEAARRIEQVLATGRRTTPVPHPCPHCRTQLRIEGGDGHEPTLRCHACGWARTTAQAA